MKWVKDHSGRFARRPHYLPAELDDECERLIRDFQQRRKGTIEYPIATDDLTVLIESLTENLDLYADFSSEGDDIEGVTDFSPGRRPAVRISKSLTENERMANRLRTTLTHELGHVHFHTFMFDAERSGDLFVTDRPAASNKCHRMTMLHASETDWMEWQAGYACGAFLMPTSALRETVRAFLREHGLSIARFGADTQDGQALIETVAQAYAVSRDAARVRLFQQGNLATATAAGTLV